MLKPWSLAAVLSALVVISVSPVAVGAPEQLPAPYESARPFEAGNADCPLEAPDPEPTTGLHADDEPLDPLEAPEPEAAAQSLKVVNDGQLSVLLAAVRRIFRESAGLGLLRLRKDVPTHDESEIDQWIALAEETTDYRQWPWQDDAEEESAIECWITRRDCMDWIMWLSPEAGLVQLAFADTPILAADLPNEPPIPPRDAVSSSEVTEFPWADLPATDNPWSLSTDWDPFLDEPDGDSPIREDHAELPAVQQTWGVSPREGEPSRVIEFKFWSGGNLLTDTLLSLRIPEAYLLSLAEPALRPRTWTEMWSKRSRVDNDGLSSRQETWRDWAMEARQLVAAKDIMFVGSTRPFDDLRPRTWEEMRWDQRLNAAPANDELNGGHWFGYGGSMQR